MAVKNNTILYKAYLQGSSDYQRRMPSPTQATMAETVDKLFEPMNGQCRNEFMDTLIQRIGDTVVHQKEWENPLAVFKGAKMNYGSTIQEIATKWVQAHSYDDASETLLKMERPEAAVCYHSINRRDRYDITVSPDELRQAFTEEYGLNKLINAVLQVPINSDNYDEYRAMLELIAFYETKWGFFKHQLSAAPTDEATSKEFLKAIRSYAGKLRFPSTLYNAGVVTDIPVFANPEECVLLITPDALSSIDVDTLSSVFQLSKAELPVEYRIVVVDEFPIPDAVAILTTEDFFVCRDIEYTTASFYNGEQLTTKYYLHHWSALSVSPFVPAILFTTAAGTVFPTYEQTVTALELDTDPHMTTIADYPNNNLIQLKTTITGTVTSGGSAVDIPVAPDSATFEISAMKDDAPVNLNSRTYVDRFGRLHLQKTLPAGTELTITATSTYVNPSGETASYSDAITLTV